MSPWAGLRRRKGEVSRAPFLSTRLSSAHSAPPPAMSRSRKLKAMLVAGRVTTTHSHAAWAG